MPNTPTLTVVDAVCNAAELLLPVRETLGADGRPNNQGRFVNAIQRSTGGAPGEYWCCDTVYYVGHGVLRERWPMPRTGACQACLDFARARGVVHTTPQRGDQFVLCDASGHAHHTGFVTGVHSDGSWEAIEGNARDQASASSDGDGVHHCVRGRDGLSYLFLRWADLVAPVVA